MTIKTYQETRFLRALNKPVFGAMRRGSIFGSSDDPFFRPIFRLAISTTSSGRFVEKAMSASSSSHLQYFLDRTPVSPGRSHAQRPLEACRQPGSADPVRSVEKGDIGCHCNAFVLGSQILDCKGVRAFHRCGQENEVQPRRVGLGVGEWVGRRGPLQLISRQKVNIRLKSVVFVDCSADLGGEVWRVLFAAPEDRIAALNVGLDGLAPKTLEQCNEFPHRQGVPAADVDPTEKGDVGLHLLDASESG